jgi:shikimate kinase
MLNSRIIYIIGFMGSGKSTIGRKLASRLGWSFVDLDDLIEEKEGLKITEIFAQSGEEYFRKVETEVLRSLNSRNNTVVSTGGGTPCSGGNMDYMLGSGLTIYLKLSPGQLKSRLSGSNGERPLIKDLSHEELLRFIEEKLGSRESCYNRAEVVVEGIDLDINKLHSILLTKINISRQ